MRVPAPWRVVVATLLAAILLSIAPARAAEGPSLQQQIVRAHELMSAGKLDEALATVDSALVQAEATRDPGSVASVLMLRAGLQTARRDFPAAESSAKRAYELAGQLTGPRQPIGTIMSMQISMNAAMLYQLWGRPGLAEPWALRAVSAAEKIDRNGGLHAVQIGLLAMVEEAIGKSAQAQQHWEQVLDIAEKASKRDLADEASTLLRLGDLRGLRGDVTGAREAYARALEREPARDGDAADPSPLARSARIFRALGREADAQAALERAYAAALAAAEVVPMAPSTSPQDLAKRRAASATVFAWREIGRVERDLGRVDKAEAALRRALALSERMDGPDNLNLPAMQVELGQLLLSRAAWDEAEAVYTAALASLDRSPGGMAADMPDVLEGLARARLAKGEPARAETAVRREINLYETYVASDHPKLASALDLLAEILVACGRGDEAKPVLSRAAAIKEMKR